MRHYIFLILFIFLTPSSFSQLNMTKIGYLDIPALHSTICNDIWGYEDEKGNEYALVGTEDGVSIVNISDPSFPIEVAWIPGLYSIWRDIKTYGDVAYVTTEALQGLMIIDLSPLPEVTDLPVFIYDGPADRKWFSAHNLYQDNGFVYIFGAARDNGGVIILDVASDPLNPVEVGVFDDWYAHDGFVRDNIAYFGHIYDGIFSIVDVSDKMNPVLLGSASTPTTFAHNVWASEDGNYVFTTDEVSGGYIASFDVSDPTNIKYLDKIQASPGDGVFPHNAHVKGGYLYTSYYTAGIVIHDITHPNNMIEVGNFDTSPLASPTTDGCWGTYPFHSSGYITASDRQEGLFVFETNLHQGSYLKGTITALGSGMALNNVSVTLGGTVIKDESSIFGDYATGIESEGTFDVTYFKVLYYPKTLSIPFKNGVTVEQDVILEQIPEFSVKVAVFDAETLLPIEGAKILFEHTYTSQYGTTDAAGEAIIPLYYQDNYQLYAGKWGYITTCYADTMVVDGIAVIEIYINKGIYDDFTFDFGWTTAATAARGFWVRDIPVGAYSGDGAAENPPFDSGFDCGKYAFMTGNGSIVSNTTEVNDGEVYLFSPVFDLTGFEMPYLNYATWFFCLHGAEPDDTMRVYLTNGTGAIVEVEKFYNGGLPMSQWNASSIEVKALITPTANMQLIIELSDYLETENVTEGGFDFFSITDYSIAATEKNQATKNSNILIYPNPFNNTIQIKGVTEGMVEIYDVSGRFVHAFEIQPTIQLELLERGTYFFSVNDRDGNRLEVFTQIKL